MSIPSAPDAPPPQWRLSSDRINAIRQITGGTRYLEIGVYRAQTFTAVDYPHRCGVDPDPLFDVDAIRSASTEFHVASSDAFFVSAPPRTFDTVFIDGLHTFEQTFRDFANSLSFAHPRTVWVIDDTWPSDALSAVPDHETVKALRKLTGDRSVAWHGDIFKVILALHDFFPLFDFRTITDRGNPQTLVTRSSRADFKPRWNSLEAISRLGYTDFLQLRDLLKPCTETVALDWLKQVTAAP